MGLCLHPVPHVLGTQGSTGGVHVGTRPSSWLQEGMGAGHFETGHWAAMFLHLNMELFSWPHGVVRTQGTNHQFSRVGDF